MTPISKSKLSCTHCRRRKVGCNRALPSCTRCVTQQLECFYPLRQPRHARRKIGPPTLDQQGALSAILSRLQCLEEQNATGGILPGSSTTTAYQSKGTTPDNGRSQGCSSASAPQSSGHSRHPGSPVSTDNVGSDLTALVPSLMGSEDVDNDTSLDITSVLSHAVNEVQQLRKKHYFGVRALTMESVSIPSEYAKQWIDNYFTNINGKLLPAMVDRKLIDMIPDLIGMDHVHIDASMLIIYYCILWQGLWIQKPGSCKNPDKHYARQIFICCRRTIPIWQQEAIGSVTDFIAAIYMTQTATENFDFSLSWEMHKLACEYAHTSQMHSLDSLEHSNTMSDNDRMGMWDLIQLDLFFRLINNKPAAFSSRLSDWRVNMPRLSVDFPRERDEAVPTTAFIIRSRLMFILISYFQVSEALRDEEDVLAAVNPLCEEVEKMFEEWKIEEWLESYKDGDINAWVLGDLALSGYTCILFMLRKASFPTSNDHQPLLSNNDDMIPRTDLSMRTSRRILQAVHHMLYVMRLPGPEAMALILGYYRAYIAHAHLASGVARDPTAPTARGDLLLLRDVTECIEGLAREGLEFFPLVRAFRLVNSEVERRVQEA